MGKFTDAALIRKAKNDAALAAKDKLIAEKDVELSRKAKEISDLKRAK